MRRSCQALPYPDRHEPDRGVAHACLVCGSELDTFALSGLRRCRECGFVTADSALDAAELAALYQRDYFHGSEYHDYLEERESLRLNFDRRLATLEKLMDGLSGRSLLEVGSAYGFFLELATERGIHATGIDIAAEGVEYTRKTLGLPAEFGDYLALRTEPVDVVTLWDTLEHLARPDLFVAKAATDLRPGGLIAITTGDIGSFNARMRRSRWRMIHPPTHLHYFSVATLSRLLQRNGFEVVHISHPGVSRRLHAILYMVLAQRLGMRRLCERVARIVPNAAITLNLYDIMYVVARRCGQTSHR
jgi:SAM-dependent methyltransferase